MMNSSSMECLADRWQGAECTIQAIVASAAASALVLFAGTEDNSLSHSDLGSLSSFCLCYLLNV